MIQLDDLNMIISLKIQSKNDNYEVLKTAFSELNSNIKNDKSQPLK
ncbi:hypothetical protein [Clostridium puniceum]|nr:hypothetical protein [Clostridium puniceum]